MGKTSIDIEKLKQDYREGRSLREIALECGVSHVQVGRLLKSAGEPLRVPRSNEIRQRMVDAKQTKAIVQQRAAAILLSNGMTPVEVATALGHTYDWVRRKAKDEGMFVP